MTNAEFSKKDQGFIKKCEEVDIFPTLRQASKYRNKKGAAYKGLKKKSN